MLRYLALLWNGADADAAARAKALGRHLASTSDAWSLVFSKPDASLWVLKGPFDSYAAHSLANTSGAMIGVVFDRNDPNRSSARVPSGFFDEDETERILRTGGRRLIDDYWGRYVAFIYDANTLRKRVLRDPIGDIPCYHAAVPGIHLYFSCVSDILRISALQPTVNWEHLRARVIMGNAWADESALNEIESIHPGECVEHAGSQISREFYWHPFAIARLPPIERADAAAAELRSTTLMCTSAWASLHEKAVHILSGGLDSSIVASCLASTWSPRRISCLNFRTRDPDSDERLYARLAAGHAGFELAEVERQPLLALERILECAPTAGPQSFVMRGLEVQPLITQFAQESGATAVFSGDGGDTVFFRGWPDLAVIDYARARGLGPGLLKRALAAALPAQLSVWRLLADALTYGVLRRPWSIEHLVFDHYRLVSDEALASARKLDLLNPWQYPVDDLPPGKRLHAFSAIRPGLLRDPLPGSIELDFIHPLLSQPVIELCLRIPTWLHAAGGEDRAVARAAFTSDLPPEIARRTWKGAADRHLKDLLMSNLTLVRESLLDGGLVKAGILDARRVADALSTTAIRSATHATEIFGYFCTETWLRHWSTSIPEPARAMSMAS